MSAPTEADLFAEVGRRAGERLRLAQVTAGGEPSTRPAAPRSAPQLGTATWHRNLAPYLRTQRLGPGQLTLPVRPRPGGLQLAVRMGEQEARQPVGGDRAAVEGRPGRREGWDREHRATVRLREVPRTASGASIESLTVGLGADPTTQGCPSSECPHLLLGASSGHWMRGAATAQGGRYRRRSTAPASTRAPLGTLFELPLGLQRSRVRILAPRPRFLGSFSSSRETRVSGSVEPGACRLPCGRNARQEGVAEARRLQRMSQATSPGTP